MSGIQRDTSFSKILVVLAVLLMFSTCGSTNKTNPADKCGTKYPVILVHGIAFRDSTLGYGYWGDIPEKLIDEGAIVYTGGQDAYGSIENNAGLLKSRILEILKETGAEKVNIIAHSRGGIESRYMISRLDMAEKVATLTTVSTPHRGSILANIILTKVKGKKAAGDVIDMYSGIIGDSSPDSVKAGTELTIEYMKAFNLKVPDMPGVYYQSYGSVISSDFPNPVWVSMYETVREYEGENDGLVSESSCRWGRFRGLVTCRGKLLVSHSDIIGMHILTGEYCFDAAAFYISVVSELKSMGY